MPHWKTMFDPGKYIGGWELVDDRGEPKDYTLQIEKVVPDRLALPGTSKTERKPVVYFKGSKKPLVLNRTNSTTVAKMYGDHTEGWIGKRVTLYFDPTVKMKGETTGGIRIRPMIPKPATKTDEELKEREPDAATIERHAAAQAKSEVTGG